MPAEPRRAVRRRPRAFGVCRTSGVAALLLAAHVAAQPPALDYVQHCAGCHHADGRGSARNDVPDMRGVIGAFAHTPSGRAFLVQVAGVAQAPLGDAAVAALLNWLLPQMDATGTGIDFEPYTASEVALLRGARPANLAAVRADAIAEYSAARVGAP